MLYNKSPIKELAIFGRSLCGRVEKTSNCSTIVLQLFLIKNFDIKIYKAICKYN